MRVGLFGVTVAVGLSAAACGSSVTVTGGQGGASSSSTITSTPSSVSSSVTAASSSSGGVVPACCADDEVLRSHACLPTTELGCGESCMENGCPEGWRCEPCAASGPCGEEICQPACVLDELGPSVGIEEGAPRITPTQIAPNDTAWVNISGSPFYVGALWYEVRVGDLSTHVLQGAMVSGPCQQAFEFGGVSSGFYPVWVSQYGGGEPWILSGFLSIGLDPVACTQPGYPCATDGDCCETDDAPVACIAGHCMASSN